jgi:acetolactate synthase-1/2/3 large subunit
MLLAAKRPLILAGGGVLLSEASQQLAAFAEHVNVPVYTTFMGKGALSARHPLHLGIAGCWGEYPATEATRNADVILALGCRFSDIHCSSWVPGYTYNIPPTKLIHVDIDATEIGRNYPTELGIVGDAREVLDQLLELAQRRGPKRGRTPWHDQLDGYKTEWRNFVAPFLGSDESPIDPRRVIGDMRRVAPDDTLMITDTGNHQTWVEQYWDVYEPRTTFTPGGFAGMGFGTCGVLGLKLARPERPCVCVTSDGSFSMFPHAVATAVEYDLPCVWVLLNNYTIGVIRDLQRFYMDNREIGTSFRKQATGELWNPDFAKMAEAMGALAYSIDQPGDFGSAFEDALNSGRPALLDVKINRDTAVPLIGTWQFPPIVQAEPTFGQRLVLT